MGLLIAARPDFGFGNPNIAAAFLAMLAVAAWAIPLAGGRFRPIAFWAGLAVGTALAGLLVATASRGGVIALLAGLAACWVAAGCPRPKVAQVIGIAVAAGLLFATALWSRMGERVADSSASDGSITARVAIWQEFPAMLTASPGGWGLGNAAQAYQNWFQSPDDTRTYKHLVSTHATWMVEQGWILRVAYLFALAAILLLCWDVPVALGVWAAFVVAGIFSHVGADWRLWVPPGASLLFVLLVRFRGSRWPRAWAWAGCLAVAVFGAALLWSMGHFLDRKIWDRGWGVVVGSGEPKTWIFSPSPAVLGRSYGKVVRQLGSACVAWQFDHITGAKPKRIILSGDAPISPEAVLPEAYDLLWLNPPPVLDEGQKNMVEKASMKTVVWGEMRTDGSPRKLKAWFEALPEAQWKLAPGSGMFLGQSQDALTVLGP